MTTKIEFDIHAITGPLTDMAMTLDELPKLPADEYEAFRPQLEDLPNKIRSLVRRLDSRADHLRKHGART